MNNKNKFNYTMKNNSRNKSLQWNNSRHVAQSDTQIAQLYKLTFLLRRGKARTQSPAIKNNAPELPTFGVIAEVNPT